MNENELLKNPTPASTESANVNIKLVYLLFEPQNLDKLVRPANRSVVGNWCHLNVRPEWSTASKRSMLI